jgi:hypothetical protein
MIWTLVLILLVLWLLGFGPLAMVGSALHVLLVIVLVLVILQLTYWGPRSGGPPPL